MSPTAIQSLDVYALGLGKYLAYLHHMLNWNSSHGDNARLTSGRPILHAEGQFMLSHYSPSQFVPMKTIGARNLKEVLRKAIAESNGNQSLEVDGKDKVLRSDEIEMTSLEDVSGNRGPGTEKFSRSEVDGKSIQDHTYFSELLHWICKEGEDFVLIETIPDLNKVFTLLNVISRSRKPVLTTLLIPDAESNMVSVSLSSVVVDLQCLLFCMFQASMSKD